MERNYVTITSRIVVDEGSVNVCGCFCRELAADGQHECRQSTESVRTTDAHLRRPVSRRRHRPRRSATGPDVARYSSGARFTKYLTIMPKLQST